MGVHDAWQRQGVGTTLLAALVDAADNWMGLKRIELTVFSDNAAAIRLYEKFGFEPEGICRAFAFRTAVTPMRYLWRGFRILPARRADFTPLGNAPRQSAVVAFAVWTSQGFTHKPTPNAGGVRRPFLHAQMGLAALKSKPFPPGSR